MFPNNNHEVGLPENPGFSTGFLVGDGVQFERFPCGNPNPNGYGSILNQELGRRVESMFPSTGVTFGGYPIFDPQPYVPSQDRSQQRSFSNMETPAGFKQMPIPTAPGNEEENCAQQETKRLSPICARPGPGPRQVLSSPKL